MADGFGSDPAGPEELARCALQWLLRGGTWQALARELAWTAVRSAGANYETIDWLTPLVEARLGEHVDGLEFAVDMAAVRARTEHVERWPHDLEGADTAATLDGYDEAVQRLSRLYYDELEWAVELIADRIDHGRSRRRHSPWAVIRRRPPSDVDVPADVATELVRDRKPFGWPKRRAA